MKINTKSYAFRFFAINLFFPLSVHIAVGLVGFAGPDLRILPVALLIIGLVNVTNLSFAFHYRAWQRVGLLVITAFNLISALAMGALAFLTSLFGWVHIVPDLVHLLTGFRA